MSSVGATFSAGVRLIRLPHDSGGQRLPASRRWCEGFPHQEALVILPAPVQDVDGRIDGPVLSCSTGSAAGVPANLIVQMRAGAPAGVAHGRHDVSPADGLSGLHPDLLAMPVHGGEEIAMAQDHHVAETPPDGAAARRELPGEGDHAVGRGVHRGAHRRRQIEARMEVELARERAAAPAERAGDHEVVAQGADRRGQADAILMFTLEGADRGQRCVEQGETLPDAEAPPVSLLDGSRIDGFGQVLDGEQRTSRALRLSMRQTIGQKELVEAEVKTVRLLFHLPQSLKARLQELPLPGSLGGEGGVLLIVEPGADQARRQSGAESEEEDVDEGDDAEEGDLNAAEEQIAHPPADVARMDLDLDAPALDVLRRRSHGRGRPLEPETPEPFQELHAEPAAEAAGAGAPSGLSRSTSASLAWLATTSHSSRCTSLPPATRLPPWKYLAPPSRSVTTPPASSTRRTPAPMSQGERRNSKKPS